MKLSKRYPYIRGAGGDDDENQSGGTRTPIISADSLRSVAYLRILDLLAEGQIVGLVNGSRSIYLNRTALQNADGTYNFQNVQWSERTGSQYQRSFATTPAVEREIGVGAEFKYGVSTAGDQPSNIVQSGTAITRTVIDPTIDVIRVRVSVPSLTSTNSSNGDTSGTSVRYSVWYKPSDSAVWIKGIDDTISGKSSTRYERTRKFRLTGEAPWLIRMQRETPDSTSTYLQNATTWESYTEITEVKLIYPNSALIGIEIDATQFSSVPARAYEVDLLKIRVPSNYNDKTRVYTGVWDGTFKISAGACSNPAWVFYDLLLSSRYGLGDYISPDQVDKWALYQIGRYCDEMVDDGRGEVEPRFACNILIPGRTEAYELLKSLSSIFRGMIYWASGSISTTQDSPKDPVYLYNQSNVIDGRFAYQGASSKTRHTVVRVTWNDPSKFYEAAVEYVEDAEAVRDLGVIETSVVAVGCTSQSQANRLGRWILFTERYENETVSFATGLEGLACVPGDIIQVSDPSRAGATLGGRTSASTTTQVTLDRELEVGTAGTLLCLLPNGTVEERAIDNIVGRVVTVTTPYSLAPQPQGAWIVKTASIEPQLFKVVGVVEDQSGSYAVTGLRHYPSKYDFIENGIKLEIPDTTDLDEDLQVPQNLSVLETLYSTGTDTRVRATLSWNKVPLAANYRVTYSYNSGNPVTLPLTQFTEISIEDVLPGTYYFTVVAINSLGTESTPGTLTYEVVGKTAPPQDVQNFSVIPSQGNAEITWNRATDLDVIIGGYVRIRWTPRLIDQKWADGIDITPALTGNSTGVMAPLLAGTYMAKFVDSSGNFSEHEKLVITSIADIYALNRVETITEDPDFSGELISMVFVSEEDAITMASDFLIDDVGDIEALGSFDFMGGIVAQSEYHFDGKLDLLGVWPFRVRVHVDLESYDTGNYIDERLDMVDDFAFWDGEAINALDAQVHMRTTEDDPLDVDAVWSPWKKIVNAEYRAWGAEFKLVCYNDQPNHNLYIRELGVVVDMEDRTWNSVKLESSTTGDVVVQFDPAFFVTPAISVTAENMNSGDYYRVVTLDEEQMTISFYNAANARVKRDFYILAKAYGIRLT